MVKVSWYYNNGKSQLVLQQWQKSVGTTTMAKVSWYYNNGKSLLVLQQWQKSVGMTTIVKVCCYCNQTQPSIVLKDKDENCWNVTKTKDNQVRTMHNACGVLCIINCNLHLCLHCNVHCNFPINVFVCYLATHAICTGEILKLSLFTIQPSIC